MQKQIAIYLSVVEKILQTDSMLTIAVVICTSFVILHLNYCDIAL